MSVEQVAAILRPLVKKHGLALVRERWATGSAVWDLLAIEEEAGSFVIRPPKPLNRCNASSKQNRRNTQ